MKVSALMRWAGPAAIAGAWFTVISDQLGLVTHLPEVGTAETTGYHAVGSGLFLLVLTLLFVGMLGLYARWSGPDGPTVIEYGDGYARYVLVEFSEEGLHRANGQRGVAGGRRTPGSGRDGSPDRGESGPRALETPPPALRSPERRRDVPRSQAVRTRADCLSCP